ALRWLNMQPSDPEEVRQALDRIVRNGRRAGDVISRIRALVAKAAPRNDLLDINEVIIEVIALTRSELRLSGTSLRTHLTEGLPFDHRGAWRTPRGDGKHSPRRHVSVQPLGPRREFTITTRPPRPRAVSAKLSPFLADIWRPRW